MEPPDFAAALAALMAWNGRDAAVDVGVETSAGATHAILEGTLSTAADLDVLDDVGLEGAVVHVGTAVLVIDAEGFERHRAHPDGRLELWASGLHLTVREPLMLDRTE